ncbi:MAG: hypothetical protein K2N38_06215 [Oscillospiraceae bacterium]|nr:hypothetical protein [Oscillospiraceae bacterium]
MAKYTVTFSCGHTATVELFGKETDRQRKIEWFGRECKCKACQERETVEFRTHCNTVLADKGYKFNFNGTEKQVAYAEDIMGCALINIFNRANKAAYDSECWDACARFFMAIVTRVLKIDMNSAKSVIDSKIQIEAKSKAAIDTMSKLITSKGTAEAMKMFDEQTAKVEVL